MPRSSNPPLSLRASNLHLRVLRCMRLCGVEATDDRLRYVRAVCAFRTLRGNSQRRHLLPIIFVLLQDARVADCAIDGAEERERGRSPLERATKAAEDDLHGHVLHMIEKKE